MKREFFVCLMLSSQAVIADADSFVQRGHYMRPIADASGKTSTNALLHLRAEYDPKGYHSLVKTPVAVKDLIHESINFRKDGRYAVLKLNLDSPGAQKELIGDVIANMKKNSRSYQSRPNKGPSYRERIEYLEAVQKRMKENKSWNVKELRRHLHFNSYYSNSFMEFYDKQSLMSAVHRLRPYIETAEIYSRNPIAEKAFWGQVGAKAPRTVFGPINNNFKSSGRYLGRLGAAWKGIGVVRGHVKGAK